MKLSIRLYKLYLETKKIQRILRNMSRETESPYGLETVSVAADNLGDQIYEYVGKAAAREIAQEYKDDTEE